MSGLPLMPAILVEVVGALIDLALAFLAARYAWKLTRLKPDNLLWQYLFYATAATAAFSVARAVGHIAREGLNLMGRDDLWFAVSPWAGMAALMSAPTANVVARLPASMTASDATSRPEWDCTA